MGFMNRIEVFDWSERTAISSTEVCHSLIQSAAAHCNAQTLISFDMWHAVISEVPLLEEQLDTAPAELDISPLYPFRNLETLRLGLTHGASLTANDIERIPNIWENIRRLHISPKVPSSQPPSINHEHVIQLVRTLPSLRNIGLRFDASRITEESYRTSVSSKIVTFSPGYSPISSPSQVASWIRTHFPYLVDLPTDCKTRVGECSLYKRRWAVVSEEWEKAKDMPD